MRQRSQSPMAVMTLSPATERLGAFEELSRASEALLRRAVELEATLEKILRPSMPCAPDGLIQAAESDLRDVANRLRDVEGRLQRITSRVDL